jgi:hypothetical protein
MTNKQLSPAVELAVPVSNPPIPRDLAALLASRPTAGATFDPGWRVGPCTTVNF